MGNGALHSIYPLWLPTSREDAAVCVCVCGGRGGYHSVPEVKKDKEIKERAALKYIL